MSSASAGLEIINFFTKFENIFQIFLFAALSLSQYCPLLIKPHFEKSMKVLVLSKFPEYKPLFEKMAIPFVFTSSVDEAVKVFSFLFFLFLTIPSLYFSITFHFIAF